ncbi:MULTISPECIES: mycofactocin biosynthesis peptidyl-dipeptidase MftE [unclassified Microbacterium]|uniref:mycofactocin biosynthesis peptidyl-dipeptidase MftE n=1 Tax=unclassified Microbacterium TaxID=2609290 RepID=UPI00214ACE15|nr:MULTISPECIES: mycofactocin biosynthesis peptidyl-dipeptidase MftE [unclassified Microbacterium]MCR2811234.1 mycofactocin biosynthesis peptidyl-dipeptidase MftE [Microbacterium sp. zg.B185]WIM19833.1 mycofactocin biosynthesis peptidyl-dipeptidase MftE [Microbacterium sp. zg-B185]
MTAGPGAGSPPLPLADVPWPRVPRDVTLLVPLGSTEQHGPHLPLDVDTAIASAVCDGVARRLAQPTVIAPAIAYGASGEHQRFAGTVSVGTDALTRTLVEFCRSARGWAGRIVFVNGHGGNTDALTAAMATLAQEATAVSWHPCRHGDVHAGRPETSIMLHLAPHRVLMDAAEPGVTASVPELLPRLRRGGVDAVSANGVLGDPRGATAAEGAAILDRMIREVAESVAGTGTVTTGAALSGSPAARQQP